MGQAARVAHLPHVRGQVTHCGIHSIPGIPGIPGIRGIPGIGWNPNSQVAHRS